jgi:hypothetical protein
MNDWASTPPDRSPSARAVVPASRLALLLLATRRLGELLAEDAATGNLAAPDVRFAVRALSRVSYGTYLALCAATDHAPDHAQDRLAVAAGAAGEHSVRLAHVAHHLQAWRPTRDGLGLPYPGGRAGDGAIWEQCQQLVRVFCPRLEAAAGFPQLALAAAPQLVGYPTAAHAATTAIAQAPLALAVPRHVRQAATRRRPPTRRHRLVPGHPRHRRQPPAAPTQVRDRSILGRPPALHRRPWTSVADEAGPVTVAPPLVYFGGKQTLAARIAGLFPDHDH